MRGFIKLPQAAMQHPTVRLTCPEFGAIIIGDEILSGKRADKHMPKVIELLSARGLSLSWADYVGDSPERRGPLPRAR